MVAWECMERRTFFIMFQHSLQVDFGDEALPDCAQTPAPRERIGNRVILGQIMFCESGIYTFVCEARVQNLVL